MSADPALSRDVYHSAEFKAFCKALNIPLELPTTKLTIVLDMDKPLQIIHEYYSEVDTPEVQARRLARSKSFWSDLAGARRLPNPTERARGNQPAEQG